jgi:GAF domain-containing protein
MDADPGVTMARALTRATRELNAAHDIQSTLDSIVAVAASEMPDIDHVGVSVAYPDGTIVTRAATGPLVRQLDELQYELREGPCVHSMTADEFTLAEDIRHDQRWPKFVPRAVELGLQAQMAIRLYRDEESLGGLNMYSTRSRTISEESRQMADLLATHASVALERTRREEHLSTALASRTVIGQAVGILMERYGLDPDQAFGYLRRVSSHSNVKLRDVADALVHQVSEQASGAPDPELGRAHT